MAESAHGQFTLDWFGRESSGSARRAFGMTPVAASAEAAATAEMSPRRMPVGPDGRPAAGAVGVLADEVMGFALISSSREQSWSVSVEISLDFLAVLPAEGALRMSAEAVDLDGTSGYSHGAIRGEAEDVLVRVRQHGRYVPRPDQREVEPGPLPSRSDDVIEVLGAELRSDPSGPRLTMKDLTPWLNPLGALHGGISICASEALATYATTDSSVPLRTTSLSIAYARRVTPDAPVEFRARVLHAGRTLRIVEVVGLMGDTPCTFTRVVRQI
jgi:acyl-coenzyme A thioesterase PaaI-like protein